MLIILSSLISLNVFAGPPGSAILDLSITIPGGNTAEIYANGNNQVEVFVNYELAEGEKVNWIRLKRFQDKQDLYDLGWKYRRKEGYTDEQYNSVGGKYFQPNGFYKTTNGNDLQRSISYLTSSEGVQLLYPSTDKIALTDICVELETQSGSKMDTCSGGINNGKVIINSIKPNIINESYFISTNEIHDITNLAKCSSPSYSYALKAIIAPPELEGNIYSINFRSTSNDSADVATIMTPNTTYPGETDLWAGPLTSALVSSSRSYHFMSPEVKTFRYLAGYVPNYPPRDACNFTLDIEEKFPDINDETNSSTHLLNMVSIENDGNSYSTSWINRLGDVYNKSTNTCFLTKPFLEEIPESAPQCSKTIAEDQWNKMLKRQNELVITDMWGTEHTVPVQGLL